MLVAHVVTRSAHVTTLIGIIILHRRLDISVYTMYNIACMYNIIDLRHDLPALIRYNIMSWGVYLSSICG